MRLKLLMLIIGAAFFIKIGYTQQKEETKSFKVSIGEYGLHCPNLGPKLKVNMKQIGADVVYFNTETSIMLVNVPSKDKEKATIAYLTKIIQLTGYPDTLITVEEITSKELIEFNDKTATYEKQVEHNHTPSK